MKSGRRLFPEKYLFFILLLLHLWPVLSVSYFVTHDGPAHLYNSKLINSLLFGHNSIVTGFYRLNPELIPNWTGHGLLSLFIIILKPALAEKLLICLYIVSIAIFFRMLVIKINPKAAVASWLIFPFIMSFPLHGGLFNFCLGVSVLLFILGYWQQHRNSINKKNGIILFILMFVLYMCHLFVFITAIFCILFFILWESLIINKLNPLHPIKNKEMRRKLIYLSAISIFPLILVVLFLAAQSSKSLIVTPDLKEMIKWFCDVRPVIALNYHNEQAFSRPLFYVYIVLFLSAFADRIKKYRKKNSTVPNIHDEWLILSGIMLLLFLFMPDALFSGSISTIRYCLMSYLFLLIYFSANCPKYFLYSGAVASVIISFLLINERSISVKSLSETATDYMSSAEQIKDHSVVMTLDYSDNWMHNNLAAYIGTEKDIVLLDNYEAGLPHFPVQWKENRDPLKIIGDFGTKRRPCLRLSGLKEKTGSNIDYVFITATPTEATDSCTRDILQQVNEHYDMIYKTPKGSGQLYKLRGTD